MPVGEPAEAVLTVPLPLQLSPGTSLMTVPAGTVPPGMCRRGMPAKFWPRSNDHEPLPTCLTVTALNVFCTRTGGASRHTSLVSSDGGEVMLAASQPLPAERSAPGASQPGWTARASKSVPAYQLSVIVGPSVALKDGSLTTVSVLPSL